MRTVFQVAARLYRRLFMSDDDFICNIFIVLRPSQPNHTRKKPHITKKKINITSKDLEEERKKSDGLVILWRFDVFVCAHSVQRSSLIDSVGCIRFQVWANFQFLDD